MLGLIIRSFDYLDKDSYIRLCKTIGRPHLEYENAVWHPNIRKDIESIKWDSNPDDYYVLHEIS